MTSMRLYLRAVFLGATLAAPAAAQQKVEVRRAATRDVYVRVNGSYASLKVMAWPHDSLALTGSLPKGARFEPAVSGQGKDASKGAKFYVEAQQPAAATGTLELFVPPGATVWAKAANARIEVSGVTGGLDLNLVGGAIVVRASPRELNIESMDGTVDVTGTPGWMRVKTASGDISVRGGCQDVGITTVGGNVTLADGAWERARIEAVTGNVTVGGTLVRAGQLTVDSHSGTITLQLPPRASLDIEATTIAGTILNRVNARRPTPGREGRGEELSLYLGTGDARATLRSFKGSIQLDTR